MKLPRSILPTLCALSVLLGVGVSGAAESTSTALSPYQVHLVRKWFEAVGAPKAEESFGELITRAARQQVGKPYGGVFKGKDYDGSEKLKVTVSRFECVSLVEASLALARCIWMEEADEHCFVREVEASRYRDGEAEDYASRLHYFTDWIDDNETRERMVDITGALGGAPQHAPFSLMSENPRTYDGLKDPEQLKKIRVIESRLSQSRHDVLDKNSVNDVLPFLESGDLVAIVSNKVPGLMIGHVGLVDRAVRDEPRYLHASSHHGKVLLTRKTVANYALRQTHRLGVVIIRPLAPPTKTRFASAYPPK